MKTQKTEIRRTLTYNWFHDNGEEIKPHHEKALHKEAAKTIASLIKTDCMGGSMSTSVRGVKYRGLCVVDKDAWDEWIVSRDGNR